MEGPRISDALAVVMRHEITSSFVAARGLQYRLNVEGDNLIDNLTFESRGRFTEDEVHALIRSVSAMAAVYARVVDAAAAVEFQDAGINHGWPSYRASGLTPTDGTIVLAISWRFTIPYRDTVISEIENLWAHTLGEPLAVPPPRAEQEPLNVGDAALQVGPDTSILMQDGVFDAAQLEDILKPRVYTEGGAELLSAGEVDALKRVMRALVEKDHIVLDEIGAYANGSDPYFWTNDYGRFGKVHFVMPPADFTDWQIDAVQVDDAPGVSEVAVGMWTKEEGASDLILEVTLQTDAGGDATRCEFVNLHVA